MHGGHPFAIRVKGHFSYPGLVFQEPIRRQAGLLGSHKETQFRGVSGPRPRSLFLMKTCIIAEGGGAEKQGQVGMVFRLHIMPLGSKPTFWNVSLS